MDNANSTASVASRVSAEHAPHAAVLDAPVREVAVLEDRAQVTRRGTLDLPAGRARIEVRGLAPVLADRTLAASAEASVGAVEVCDARVRRQPRLVSGAAPTDLEELRALVESAAQREASLELRVEALRSEGALLQRALRQTLAEVVVDAAWDRVQPDAWRGRLERVEACQVATDDDVYAAELELEVARRRLSDLRTRHATASRPDETLGASALLDLEMERAGSCSIEIHYCVPAACWRPRYRARLSDHDGASPRLELSVQGCVWQNTGEAWDDVELLLSTQRPSLGSEPPLLGDDVLLAERRREQTVVQQRDREIVTTGERDGAAAPSAELPGIDDGGNALGFSSATRVSVASSGRPHVVPIEVFEVPAEVDRVLAGELAPAVVRRCTFTHAGTGPLLTGPVELQLGGGSVGSGLLRLASPGERVELGFGPDPALRAHRHAEVVRPRPSALSRWQKVEHRVRLSLSNLGTQPRTLQVHERIPVSEIDEVRVRFDPEASTFGGPPDADGILRHSLTVPGGGTAELKLRYVVEHHKDVVGL